MAFVEENSTIVSFADFQDAVDKDQRLFEANEGLSDDVVEAHLVRATERILTKMRDTQWWRSYYRKMDPSATINTVADIPALDPNRIKARQRDFTDLCVYVAFCEYTLPSIADFGNGDSSERQKMAYYTQRSSELFAELVSAGDWYDFNNTGTVSSDEKQPGVINLKRIR